MIEAIVTWLNRLANRSRFRRFWGIATEVFWIDKIRIYDFDPILIDVSDDVSESGDSSVCWKTATEKDVDQMILLGGYDIDEEFIKSFVRSDNEYLLLGLKDNVIQTYAVCAVRQKRMNGLFFRLTDEEAFISVCFTRSDCRGQGWGPKCIREICRRCREVNLKRVFIDISTSNASSIRSAEKAGAKQTDSWYYRIRLWKRDHLFPFGQYRSRFFGD